MDTRREQLSFLKDLILQDEGEESRRLLKRICQVESQESSSRRWTILLGVGIAVWLGGLVMAARGGAWLLREAGHPLVVVQMWFGGIAVFSLLLVSGCWLWHRSVLRRLTGELQRFLAGWLATHSDSLRSPRARRRTTQCHRHSGSFRGGSGGSRLSTYDRLRRPPSMND